MMNEQISEFPILIEKEETGNENGERRMATKKQMDANRANAQQSTGPKTDEGKAIVSSNAIKHGIFTKDLIISSGAGRESPAEYEELLNNLLDCLSPSNQMESLLVEKIAVDFWRLRRTIRFEAGSISKHIEDLLKSFYSYGNTDNAGIDREIEDIRSRIEWNSEYLKCLRKSEVTFDQPTWHGKDISSDILEDLFKIARSLPELTEAEQERLYKIEKFNDLSALLAKHGYSERDKISTRLIELYSEESERLKEEIERLEQKKISNQEEDLRNAMIGSVPTEDSTEKALKYERSIQKSIFQNLFLLKKIQGVF